MLPMVDNLSSIVFNVRTFVLVQTVLKLMQVQSQVFILFHFSPVKNLNALASLVYFPFFNFLKFRFMEIVV